MSEEEEHNLGNEAEALADYEMREERCISYGCTNKKQADGGYCTDCVITGDEE